MAVKSVVTLEISLERWEFCIKAYTDLNGRLDASKLRRGLAMSTRTRIC